MTNKATYEGILGIANGLSKNAPRSTRESMFMTGFEIGLGFAGYSPDIAKRILAAIDAEVHLDPATADDRRARLSRDIIALLPEGHSSTFYHE